MTKKERIEMIEKIIAERKARLETLTKPHHIEECKRDIEFFTKSLEIEKLA